MIAGTTPILVHNNNAACPIAGHNGDPVEFGTAPSGCTCSPLFKIGPDGRIIRPNVGQANPARVGMPDEIANQRDQLTSGAKAFEKVVKDVGGAHDPTVALGLGAALGASKVKQWGTKLKDWWNGRRGQT